MAVRKIVEIDKEKCDGCGACVPNCAEGALQIIDGKAKLVSDVYCDGLGACLGYCPKGAIRVVKREAADFDEEAVKERLESMKVLLKNSPASQRLAYSCPSSQVQEFEGTKGTLEEKPRELVSQLRHWPVQLKLVPAQASFFQGADLVVSADCVPFAYVPFHQDFLKDSAVVVGCPKLDDLNFYLNKLTDIFSSSSIKSVTVVRMEVPCCAGLAAAVKRALAASGKEIPYREVVIGVKGEILKDHLKSVGEPSLSTF